MAENKGLRAAMAAEGITYDFISVSRHVRGIMYEPAVLNEKSCVGILVMHADADYLTKEMNLMARYGYRVLCANVGNPNGNLDDKISDARDAFDFLKSYPGVEKVVVWGHSGGATLLSAYQKIAENGVASCQGPEKIHKCPDKLAGMVPADGILLIDANYGNSAMSLFSTDPAVTDETGAAPLDEELNLFNPANGFDPKGSTFSKEFIAKFQKAQGERGNRLIDAALKRLESIESGEAFYEDDEPLSIIGAAQGFMNNKLYAQDVSLLSHTKEPRKLVHPDGSVTEEIVHTLRGPENSESFTRNLREGTLNTTVRNYLAEFAIRTTPEYSYDECTMNGVDWSSTYATPVGNVEDIKVPTLVMGMNGGWEYIAAESIYEHSASTDKEIAFVDGATHIYKTIKGREAEFGNTVDTLMNYVDKWLAKPGRFIG